MMSVSRSRAGMGSSKLPTSTFCDSQHPAEVCQNLARLTRMTAPGTLHACFQHPAKTSTAIVCHHPLDPEAMYALISADNSCKSVVLEGRCFRVVLQMSAQRTSVAVASPLTWADS